MILRKTSAAIIWGSMGKAEKLSKVAQNRKAKMCTVRKTSPKGEDFTLFFATDSPFSQFHPCVFTVKDIKYNCAEQYMMHQKAVVFGDDAMAAQILKESDPKKIKACGRKVQNFDDNTWTEKCRDIVREGNRHKFWQSEQLKAALFATAGSTLVEASPRDRRWGIGLGKDNPKALDKSQWRGTNWLGYILTEVREELMKKETSRKDDVRTAGESTSNETGCAAGLSTQTTDDSESKSA